MTDEGKAARTGSEERALTPAWHPLQDDEEEYQYAVEKVLADKKIRAADLPNFVHTAVLSDLDRVTKQVKADRAYAEERRSWGDHDSSDPEEAVSDDFDILPAMDAIEVQMKASIDTYIGMLQAQIDGKKFKLDVVSSLKARQEICQAVVRAAAIWGSGSAEHASLLNDAIAHAFKDRVGGLKMGRGSPSGA